MYTGEVKFTTLTTEHVVNLGHLAIEYTLPELAYYCRNHLVMTLEGTRNFKYFYFMFILFI